MTSQKSIEKLANHCVQCGLCLPHCPLYKANLNENLSPRGFISLILAISQKKIAKNPNLDQYLDKCLTCDCCEKVCPAKVNFSQIVKEYKSLLTQP